MSAATNDPMDPTELAEELTRQELVVLHGLAVLVGVEAGAEDLDPTAFDVYRETDGSVTATASICGDTADVSVDWSLTANAPRFPRGGWGSVFG